MLLLEIEIDDTSLTTAPPNRPPPPPGSSESEEGNTWLLGDAFMKNVYTIFDFDQDAVGFADLA